nr:hypothetical protein [Tanacetum cinerariifolium]
MNLIVMDVEGRQIHPCVIFIPACCDDDDDYNSAITPNEPVDSLSKGDKNLDTIPATESDEVIKSSVEDLVPIPSESEGIPDTLCDMHLVNNLTPLEAKDHFEIVINSNDDYSSSEDDSLYNENIEYVEASPHDFEVVSLEVAEIVIPEDKEIEDDNLREKLLNVHLLIAKIEALKDNPTPSSEFLTKSSSTSPKSFLEETNTFDNSLPEFENFCFDLEEISSGSTTTHSDISLSEYDSFMFDLSNDQFPPTDMSDFTHKEFTDELAHIISPPKYDCFYFRNLPDLGEWIPILNSGICENLSSTTRVYLPENDHLFKLLLSEDIVHICVNYLATRTNCREIQQSVINEYNENLVLKAELAKKKHMVEKKVFIEVVLKFSRIENRCASLELKLQHQKESFQNNRPLNNHDASEVKEFFKINEWQAKLNAKDVSIANCRKHIESLKGKNMVEKDVQSNNANVIALGTFKLDLEHLSPKELKKQGCSPRLY